MQAVQFRPNNNAEIGYTSFLMSTAAPQSTNAFTASTFPHAAASWRAVSPLCNINTSLTIILCLHNQYSFCPTSDVHVLCLCNNYRNGSTLSLVSTAAPCFTKSLIISTSPSAAAIWRAVRPYCNIMHQVTIVQTVAVVEFHLVSDVGISFSC